MRFLPREERITLLNTVLNAPQGVISSAVNIEVNNVIRKHDPQYTISHRESIQKEILDSLRKDLYEYAWVEDLSIQTLQTWPNEKYQNALLEQQRLHKVMQMEMKNSRAQIST